MITLGDPGVTYWRNLDEIKYMSLWWIYNEIWDKVSQVVK